MRPRGSVESSLMTSIFLFFQCSLMCFVFHQGLGMVEDAESYAAQADWTIIRAGTCPNSVRSNLYRTMGMIYFAKGEYPNVRLSEAQDVSEIKLKMKLGEI